MSPRFVVLDLDSTLVYSRPVSLKDMLSEDKRNFYVRPMSGVIIHRTTLRKHVHTFLDALRKNGYRIIVWSAGSAPYVKDIVSILTRDRPDLIEYVFTCEHLREEFKDLQVIKEYIHDFDVAHARLVDDNEFHRTDQEKSFVLVKPFEVRGATPTADEDDDVLETLVDRINASFD